MGGGDVIILDSSPLPYAPLTEAGLEALERAAKARANLARDAHDAELDDVRGIALLIEIADEEDEVLRLMRAAWLRRRVT